MARTAVLLIILDLLISHYIFCQPIQPTNNDKRVVIIPPGQSRTFMFTNQIGLFYYGETGQPNTSQYQGLSYLTHKFLEDYIIEASDVLLSRQEAEVHLMGDRLVRHFNNVAVEEEISVSDSLPILTVKLRSIQKTYLAIAPLISGADEKQNLNINWSNSDKVLYVSRNKKLVHNNHNNFPEWLGIFTYPEGEYSTTGIEHLTKKPESARKNMFCPGKINIYFNSEALVLFVIGNSKNEVLNNRNIMLNTLNIEIQKQNPQIEGIRKAQLNDESNSDGSFFSSFK